MNSKKRGVVGGIALAAAMAFANTAQAADDTIYTSTAQLSNLSFRLIDLDPNDGVTPSVNFGGYAVVFGLPWDDSAPRYSGSLLPTSALQADYQGGMLQATPSALTASSSITSGDLMTQITPATAGFQLVNVSSNPPSMSSVGSDIDNPYWAAINLSPNTAIVISGLASVSSSANTAKLAELINSVTPQDVKPYVDLFAEVLPAVYVSLNSEDTDFDFGGYVSNVTESRFALDGRRNSFFDNNTLDSFVDPLGEVLTKQSDFSIWYANLGSLDKAVRLDMSVHAGASVNGALDLSSNVVTPPTIPEPSTYALMGLGLVGIGLARRKAAH